MSETKARTAEEIATELMTTHREPLAGQAPPTSMTMQEFQRIVLRLANGSSLFIRSYYWTNYPNHPQVFGVEFSKEGLRGYRPTDRLRAELEEKGFRWDEAMQMYRVPRGGD